MRIFRNKERLQASLDAGHGIMLTPNHCRNADPLVMGWLARSVGTHVYAMASWHLFNQDRFTAWAIRKMGGFSVYREGVDRQAINTAIEVLERAQRPLILFPEGAVSRTNDRLHALLDGVAFIARTAAKRRAKHVKDGKVVVHPVTIKYRFRGDIAQVADAAGLSVLVGTTQELSIGVSAQAMFGSVVENLDYPGDPTGGLLYESDVVKERVQYEHGYLIIPDGPGLGLELDEEKIAAISEPLSSVS